jgi:hypothetical protein
MPRSLTIRPGLRAYVQSVSLANLLRLNRCFKVPTSFLGYYIPSELVNKHMQRRKN